MSERQERDAKNLCRVKVSSNNVKVQQFNVCLTILGMRIISPIFLND